MTEIRMAVDTARFDETKLKRADEKRIQEVLTARSAIFTTGPGKVEVQAPHIKMRVPLDKAVTPSQLASLVRPGRLEIRYLDDLRTSENPSGRYDINTITVTDLGKPKTMMRFVDQRSGRPVPAREFVDRCPLVVDNEQIQSANVVSSSLLMAVRVQFDDKGAHRLQSYVKKAGRVLAVVLDGEVISISPIVGKTRRQIKEPTKDPFGRPLPKKKDVPVPQDDVSVLDVMGGFQTADEASYLAIVLNSGSLPAPLKVVDTRLVPE